MNIIIVHNKRSKISLEKDNKVVFDLGRSGHPIFKILSNPFTHLPLNKTTAKYSVPSVEKAVSSYKTYLEVCCNAVQNNVETVDDNSKKVVAALHDLYLLFSINVLQNLPFYISCWCKDELNPKPSDHACHCDIIRNIFYVKYLKEHS